MRAVLGSWLLLLAVAGCAGHTARELTAQEECQQGGGMWRGSWCERGAGGGY